MALLRCGRGLRRAYSCCGLWVEKGVFVHFSEDDTTGAANDISALSPNLVHLLMGA
jgi:hypothetical protein